MSDPNNHEFVSNRNGLCKQITGGRLCHLPEDVLAHKRAMERRHNTVDIASLGMELAKALAECNIERAAELATEIRLSDAYSEWNEGSGQ